MKTYFVYMMANRRNGTLYTGVTNNLRRRVLEHKNGMVEGFSKKYNTTMLVYYERHNDVYRAIGREKTLKRWHRKWKLELIESMNPCWLDLYEVRCAQGPRGRLDPGSEAGMTKSEAGMTNDEAGMESDGAGMERGGAEMGIGREMDGKE